MSIRKWLTQALRVLPPVLWPALIFLAAFYIYPLMRLLRLSLFDPSLTVEHYIRLLRVPLYGAILLDTFEIAFLVAALTLILGYPTAYLLANTRSRVASFLLPFVMIPFFTSDLVRNYAWIFLLGSRGVVNSLILQSGLIEQPLPLMFNRFGVLVGMVHILLPYMVLVLLSVMRGINRQFIMSATSLGATPFTAFRRVYLPLSLPGVAGAFLLVFVLALAFFVTPAMLGGGRVLMIANVIADQMAFLRWPFAAALATVLLLVTLTLILILQRFFGGTGLLVQGLGPARLWHHRRVREGPLTWVLDRVLSPIWPFLPPIVGYAVLAYLFLPVLIIFPLSFSSAQFFTFPPPGFSLQWYEAYFASPAWLSATWNSVQIGIITSVLSMLIAFPAALGITRFPSRLTPAIYSLMLSPMILPSIITAIAVFFLFSQLHLTGTIIGVVLGQTVTSLPLATIVLVAALRNFDINLERAALSLGASPARTALRVTLPVLSTAFIVAAFFAFLHSFNELLVALFVSGISARTLPKKMWESLSEINPTIAAVSALLVGFTLIALGALSVIQRVSARSRLPRGRRDAIPV